MKTTVCRGTMACSLFDAVDCIRSRMGVDLSVERLLDLDFDAPVRCPCPCHATETPRAWPTDWSALEDA